MANLETVPQVPPPPARPSDAHKGTFGTAIVVGGSQTMPGAPALAARAALRGGVGLCKIATRPDVLPHCLTLEPSATGIELAPDGDGLLAIEAQDPSHAAVIAIGPGLGQSAEAAAWVDQALAGDWPTVLDADALNLLAKTQAHVESPSRPRVLTPHPGEFRRLAQSLGLTQSPTDPAQRPEAAARLAHAYQAVVALKGQHTVVTDGRRIFTNDTGNPAMSTAGAGDVLTGLIAALLAQGLAGFEATALAVHAHGLVADHWAERHGPAGMLARELADGVPAAMQQVRDRGRE
jgi:NAD(P)H-hydrate epimerase